MRTLLALPKQALTLLVAAFVLYAILKTPVAAAHAIHGAFALTEQLVHSLGIFFDALLSGD